MLEKRKRVLIITYYWPPSGGAGVQRWVKFVKYLREFGWEPVIYTVSNPQYPVLDEFMGEDLPKDLEVIKSKIFEPFDLYKRFMGKKKDERIQNGVIESLENGTWKEKLALWIRGNLFIPDARKFWIKSGSKFLQEYLKNNPVDAIVSTGPPHSSHLIALRLKKKGLITPWLADFRDPWTQMFYFSSLKLMKISRNIHLKQEKQVLENADKVITVGPTMNKMMASLVPGYESKFTVITNGFDAEETIVPVDLDEKFTLVFIGSSIKLQDNPCLWNVLKEKLKDPQFNASFQLKFIGKTDPYILNSIKESGLSEHFVHIDNIPHKEVSAHQRSARVLLLLLANSKNGDWILSGKFFEYLGAQREILAFGNKGGDVDEILQGINSGQLLEYTDSIGIKNAIDKAFDLYLSGENSTEITSDFQKYTRKALTEKLSIQLNSMLN
jgi:glycosyltransferase involved in cell wall biosynthesis